MTGVEVLLGTAVYMAMAPEQANRRPADKRSDIWSFGWVLFEMLPGMRAFERNDVAETLAAVVNGESNWEPCRSICRPPFCCCSQKRW